MAPLPLNPRKETPMLLTFFLVVAFTVWFILIVKASIDKP